MHAPAEMKYIIFEAYGLKQPMVFSKLFNHSAMKVDGYEPVSAGFCRFNDDGGVSCYGESVTLKLKSNPDDEKVIRGVFFEYF